MPAPRIIVDLVERFGRNVESYKSSAYNETQTRREFIDVFFEALGWDVNNHAGHAEAYKDVVHEDAVKVGGVTKAPDYCFRIGGQRKFFVEAKKPSVYIKGDPAPAYQVRRYAWSAKLGLSILTDFEEFAVYDCRVKPNQNDRPDKARTRYYTYSQYVEKWDEIAAVFSKDAILKGSFDKYADSHGAKHGTAEVDSAILAEIESWRETLARNIALRNQLNVRELNECVQRTIDRIIFLRIAEDRGIEEYGSLRGICNGANTYGRLKELFARADDRYNSGLFHFREEKGQTEPPDRLSGTLVIDDKPLKDILKRLYYPDSPYEFSVLPADILGQVYEQFLGKVIRLTSDHRAVVDDKPEVKKAGGVFYTPTYVVEYIVKNTVGRVLDGKTPKSAESIRVVDPACGSGSFLLGAYQYLLEWHLNWYLTDGPEKHVRTKKPALYQTHGGSWALTTSERKRILLNNIFGVDIDSQAVEVTKLSLLLKVLEGETEETLFQQMRLFRERALPDLGSNVKCGNSLIGPDYFDGRQMSLMADDEVYRVNVFDWRAEFPSVFAAGGFDAVIGNPPYVRQESLAEIKPYLKSHYAAYDGVADLYVYFMEKSVGLLRANGYYSIIVSSSFLRTAFGMPLRKWLKENAAVERIVDFGGLAVFERAKDTYVCIPVMRKARQADTFSTCQVPSLDIDDLSAFVDTNSYEVSGDQLQPDAWVLKTREEGDLFAKIMAAGIPLGKYVGEKFFRGLLTGLNEAFEIDGDECRAILAAEKQSLRLIHPVLGGQDIRRFVTRDVDSFIIAIPCGWTRENAGQSASSEDTAWKWMKANHPLVARRLEPYAANARKRQDKGEFWWELRPCNYYEYFDAPKIIFPDIAKGPRFVLDLDGHYLKNTAYCLGTDDKYLLGILNSRLFWFAISNISIPFGTRAGQNRYRLIYQYMEKVPIRQINPEDPDDRRLHDRIVELVDQAIELARKLPNCRTAQDQSLMKRQIEATDNELDRLIFQAYGLTEDEIGLIWNA